MSNNNDGPSIGREIAGMKSEPWLPIETKLVVGSIAAGALLLIVLWAFV